MAARDGKTGNSIILRRFSAGGVVYRQSLQSHLKKPKTLWLVTKSKPSQLFPKSVWRLPKGWLDDRSEGRFPGPLASGEKKASEKEIQDYRDKISSF